MNNIDRIKEYIQDAVISPLERLMNGDNGEPEVNLYEKYYLQGGPPPKDSVYRSLLHAMMVSYYEMYLKGDIRLCCAGNRLEFVGRKMESIIEEDDQFGSWASEQNLIAAAENWGDNLKRFEKESRRIYRFFHVLEVLLESDCQQDWRALSEKLKEMLFKSEVCYDYKTDEVLCVLHAFTMIMQQDWTKKEKKEMLDLLNQHWLFLKHYYSVMIRHIIGVKWTKFSKVAETVMSSSQSFKPHMHIFYCGLMDCVDELHLDRKHQREMDKVMLLMQEEMNRCEPSELLYPLCDAIFPEDFQRLLREHRPKSYKEIEDESHQKDELIQQLRDQTIRTCKELEKSKEIIERMVLSSIPIEDVDAELEQYPAGTAWDMLKDLNANPIISMQKAWREHYPELLKKYRSRLMEPIEQQKELTESMAKVAERPTYGTYYASGSTHDDKRSQLLLGEEREKTVPLKRISNE
jgi:hypothetical protein